MFSNAARATCSCDAIQGGKGSCSLLSLLAVEMAFNKDAKVVTPSKGGLCATRFVHVVFLEYFKSIVCFVTPLELDAHNVPE